MTDWSFSQRPSIPVRVLQAINKERVPFLLTLTLLLGVGTVLTRLPERVYESKSTLLIQAPATSTRLISPGEQPTVVGELDAVGDRVSPVNNQVALLKSRPVYDLALERLNLSSSDAPYGNLQVKGVEGTDLVEVSYQSDSAELAADVVKAVVEVYMEQNLSANREQGSQARQFIQSQLDSLQGELAQARDRLENFQTSSGFLGTTVETDAITESLSEFASQVAAARAELSATEQRIAQMRTQLSGDPLTTLNAAGVSQDPAYQELQSQLVEAQGQLADYENRFTENDPYVVSARERRDRIQALMNQRSEQLLGQQTPQQPVDPIRQRLVEQWFTLQAERSAQAARLAQLTQQYNQLQARSRQLPELIKQQSQLQLDAELAEQEYRTFEQQYTATRIAEQQEVSNVRVVEPAAVNNNPIAPNDKLLLALVVVVSTAIALALVWLLRSRSDSLEETRDLKQILPLPILATIPRRGNGRLNHEESLDHQPLSHSYRLLQAHMRMLPQQVRAIAICSWAPQEGRSSVAHNLALVEAKSGQRVLLIDAHRRPSPAYAPLLAARSNDTNGSPSWQSTVQKVLPGFDVLPQVTASLTTNYRDWLVLLDQARERYDLVILDCPPACQNADAALLASLSDGVLWVVYPDLLGRQGVEAAAETLQTWSTRLLGQVVIGVEEPLPAAMSDSSRYLVGSEV
ncbi:AAA family ATPase [Leptolyngbya sp. FACHB-541]|uniref:GumC family protein n=1 Tax=Leptolyngbya sp. FACHB-541 TaxID=2692810 RepID=UPI001684E86A|nr:GNVR domain-containing protein [Leptolyngbya sp. FACHB-541]MBD2001603.1 AAA family ATPase [Leptolyngbya sp. FACHB-541]